MVVCLVLYGIKEEEMKNLILSTLFLLMLIISSCNTPIAVNPYPQELPYETIVAVYMKIRDIEDLAKMNILTANQFFEAKDKITQKEVQSFILYFVIYHDTNYISFTLFSYGLGYHSSFNFESLILDFNDIILTASQYDSYPFTYIQGTRFVQIDGYLNKDEGTYLLFSYSHDENVNFEVFVI